MFPIDEKESPGIHIPTLKIQIQVNTFSWIKSNHNIHNTFRKKRKTETKPWKISINSLQMILHFCIQNENKIEKIVEEHLIYSRILKHASVKLGTRSMNFHELRWAVIKDGKSLLIFRHCRGKRRDEIFISCLSIFCKSALCWLINHNSSVAVARLPSNLHKNTEPIKYSTMMHICDVRW